MGRSRPFTPLVGIAQATIIIMNTVMSSPRFRAQLRWHHPRIRCKVRSRTKKRKKAAGVADVKAREVPLINWRP